MPLDMRTEERQELSGSRRVFLVSAWGYAADHKFGWFPKALNAHPEIFALLAHEGSRPKYFSELTRGDRPSLRPFVEFLNDMGMTYEAIGDCYSYRAPQLASLMQDPTYTDVPLLNLTRHPICWLEYYTRWRTGNMRMRGSTSSPIWWEWQVANHSLFRSLGLQRYQPEDVRVWSFYQGLFLLNNIRGEVGLGIPNVRIEEVIGDRDVFDQVVSYLTNDRIHYSDDTWAQVEAMRSKCFRGEREEVGEAEDLMRSWEEWQRQAFVKLVSPEALADFEGLGYSVPTPTLRSRARLRRQARNLPSVNVFHSSLMKSGTWAMRERIRLSTGLSVYEPPVPASNSGGPDYADHSQISFPPGSFYSFHQEVTPKAATLLRGARAKSILQVRALPALVMSMYNHLRLDPDRRIGRSVGDTRVIGRLDVAEGLALTISGFQEPGLSWRGLRPHIVQLKSFVEYVERGGDALIVDYDDLIGRPEQVQHRLESYLEVERASKAASLLRQVTSWNPRRSPHKTRASDRELVAGGYLPLHDRLILGVVAECFPDARSRLDKVGLPNLLPTRNG